MKRSISAKTSIRLEAMVYAMDMFPGGGFSQDRSGWRVVYHREFPGKVSLDDISSFISSVREWARKAAGPRFIDFDVSTAALAVLTRYRYVVCGNTLGFVLKARTTFSEESGEGKGGVLAKLGRIFGRKG